MSSLHIVK